MTYNNNKHSLKIQTVHFDIGLREYKNESINYLKHLKRIRNAEKMTLFSQENNISPSQKYEITDVGLVLIRY